MPLYEALLQKEPAAVMLNGRKINKNGLIEQKGFEMRRRYGKNVCEATSIP
jgi:hypothetical protein